ncbi:FecR family protein [Sphingopyxis sp. YR583]|uniref:FecR family protein n=1 Tax=Sphingopyxis sp. YR583 TaxID=1881047 RepID=UPI0008A7DED9|nr:FecR family protein [Sphingopyxis sp. YR583]SEH12747.1 FecR family protein [Sphingopyxis sp. YR583]
MTESDQNRRAIAKGPDAAQEAADWLARMTSGDVSAADFAEFGRWIENPDHAEAYNEAERIWMALGSVIETPSNVVPLRPAKPSLGWRRFAAMAASLAVAVAGAYQYQAVWQYDHATQGSAVASLVLADGSRVELNTNSAIDYEYRDGVRHVTLAKGEAFFDVKRDTAHPFAIDAGGAEVRVLGTAFSVRRDADGGAVVVQRGKVRVTTPHGRVDLTPDQAVRYDARRMSAIEPADASKALSWSRGLLVIEDKPLGEVVAELDRYYPGVIVLADDRAAKTRVGAVVEIARIDDWLAALENSHGVDVTVLPGVTYIR